MKPLLFAFNNKAVVFVDVRGCGLARLLSGGDKRREMSRAAPCVGLREADGRPGIWCKVGRNRTREGEGERMPSALSSGRIPGLRDCSLCVCETVKEIN